MVPSPWRQNTFQLPSPPSRPASVMLHAHPNHAHPIGCPCVPRTRLRGTPEQYARTPLSLSRAVARRFSGVQKPRPVCGASQSSKARPRYAAHKASGTSFVRSSHAAYQDAFNRRTCAVTASMLTWTVTEAAAASARHSGGRSGSILYRGDTYVQGGIHDPRARAGRCPMALRRMAGRPSAQAARGERPRSSAPAHTAAPCGGTPG